MAHKFWTGPLSFQRNCLFTLCKIYIFERLGPWTKTLSLFPAVLMTLFLMFHVSMTVSSGNLVHIVQFVLKTVSSNNTFIFWQLSDKALTYMLPISFKAIHLQGKQLSASLVNCGLQLLMKSKIFLLKQTMFQKRVSKQARGHKYFSPWKHVREPNKYILISIHK